MFTFLKRFFATRQEEVRDSELIIEEFWQTDFKKSGTIRFIEESGDSYTSKIDQNGLSLFCNKKNVYAWTINPVYRYKDFILEALISFPGPMDGKEDQDSAANLSLLRAGTMATGFLFRYLSESTFYSVLVSDQGMIRMDAVVNGTQVPVLGWTETRQMTGTEDDKIEQTDVPYRQSKQVYSLRIIARGTSFTLILNDIWVAECADDFIQAPGKIAFATQNWGTRANSETWLKAIALDSRPMEVETVYTRWNQYMKISPDAHLNLARTWYAMGKYVPAILELKRAWKNREPGTEELLLSAQVYLAQRLFPEAETQVRKALSLDQENGQATAELGGILYLQNRFIELDDLLKTLPAETVGTSGFLSNLSGHLFHWKGDHARAAEAYRTAAELTPDQGLFALSAGNEWKAAGNMAAATESWLTAAKIFLAGEEYENLEEVIRLLRAVAESDSRVQAIAGKYLYATGRQDEALVCLEKAVQDESGDSSVWYLYGMILSANNKPDEAITAFRKALLIEENYGPYQFRLAETLFFAGKECTEELDRALESDKDNGWVFNLAALKALREKHTDQAESYILEARKLLPDELPVLVNFAEIKRLQGKLDEALSLFDQDNPDDLRAGANLLVEDHRHEEAEDWYLKALRRRPFDEELLTDRAANCLELDLINEADDLLGRALDIKPSPRIYQLISYLSGKKGEYPRAEVALQQGLSDFPEDPDLLYDLGTLYVRARKLKKAGEISERLLRVEKSGRAEGLALDITENSSSKVTCSICGRSWRVPKDIPPQPSLHLTAQPPDDLPAGTCPSCGDVYCIQCAKGTLGEDGRFRCRTCKLPLKLIDPNIIWLLARWQASQMDAE
jgi:tetratricopeptide (TPR) repeat protein